MANTRPKTEQVSFESSKTGSHILDTYMESCEKGNRTLADMLDDLFNASTGDLLFDINFWISGSEWANNDEDVLVSAAAGGDQIDDYSAKHHAIKASQWAAAASASASSAQGSATTATTQAGIATTQANTATTKAGEALTSANNAASSATTAGTNATLAQGYRADAETFKNQAEAAKVAAEAAYDSFDDRYLGSKTSDPALDNDGNALLVGALYFNSTSGSMRVFTGTIWDDAYASIGGALLAANNLSELTNITTARSNLGLGSAATQPTSAFATAAQGANADSALQPASIGVSVQAYSSVLQNTTASFTTADESKLDGIEALADVTDVTNVSAAGASIVSSNSAPPATTPNKVGDIYVDTLNDQIYVATGTASSADWTQAGSLVDGDYGDITVSGGGSILTIDNGAVSYEKIQNVSSNNLLLGRNTAGAGVIEELSAATVRTILNVEDGADVTDATNVSTAGAPIISSGIVAPSSTPAKVGDLYVDTVGKDLYAATGTSSSADWTIVNVDPGGVSNGDKGDITVSGAGNTWIIDAGVVTFAKMQDISGGRLLGRPTGAGSSPITEMTAADVRTLINVEDGADVTSAAGIRAAGGVTTVTDASVPSAPTHVGEIYYNTSKEEMYIGYGTAAGQWKEIGTIHRGTASPVGVVTPHNEGDIYIDTTNDAAWISVGLTSSNWRQAGIADGTYSNIQVSGGGTTWNIVNDAVTFARMQNISVNTIMGRITAGTGDPEALTAANVRTIINVENGADVTDAANVSAAGATMISSGTASPGTPAKIGNMYVETDIDRVYLAVDTSGTALVDWLKPVNLEYSTVDPTVDPPRRIGDLYVNYSTDKFWISTGTISTADWIELATTSAYAATSSGTGNPPSTRKIGDIYVETDVETIYIAKATTGAANWVPMADARVTPVISLGTAVPAVAPDKEGDIFVDTTNDNVYMAKGSATSGDWVQVNGGAGVSDGDKGDITVSGSGTTWAIDNNVVTLAKMADIATASILGRVTAATGDPEVLTATQVRTLLNVADGAQVNTVDSVNSQTGAVVLDADDISDAATTKKFTTAGDISKLAGIEAGADVTDATNVSAAGAPIISSGTTAPGSTPAKVGDIYVNTTGGQVYGASGAASSADWKLLNDGAGGGLTDSDYGDITVSGGGTVMTIDNNVVNLAKFQDIATASILGRVTAATGDPEVLTATQVRTLLNVADGAQVNTVDSVNSQTGAVVLDADDISDAATTKKFTTAGDISKLAGIEAGADVTDAANVSAAGAPIISTGAGAPASTPSKEGDIYVDTTGDLVYGAAGTASSADWKLLNDGAGGGVTDGDKGDITVSGSGANWTIDPDAVTYPKIQNVSATDRILGRATAGAGDIEEITCTAAGRALLDDADATAQRATLGLVIGTNVQAFSTNLNTWSGLAPSANAQSLVTAADYAAMRALLDLEAGTDFYSIAAADAAFQPLATVLTNTTASFTTALETKLNGIEALADVTDATNVSAAGAPIISSGAGAPASTPSKEGDIYVDTTGDLVYGAAGTASSADWKLLNDGAGGGLSDADYGDITVSGTGTVMTIDNSAVTYPKIQNVSATDRLLGRSTAGAGVIEEITCTAAGRALLDDADATAQRATLGLVIGTNVQAYNDGLADIAGLAKTDSNIIVGNGTNWVAESGVTARASLGLAIGTNVQAWSSVLDATTASFTTADETKLDAIEALADVTDATNVSAAGAAMISTGSGAPASTPAKEGNIYVDTTNDNTYVAAGSASSADWKQVNNVVPVYQTLSAASGVSFSAGQIGYVTSTGVQLADADAESTASRRLVMATASISAGGSGVFLLYGPITLSSLTEGVYWVSTTAGGITATKPTATGDVVRVVGYAESTTSFFFDPDKAWIVLV